MRTTFHIEVRDISNFKRQLLSWSAQFRECLFLDSCDFSEKYSQYDAVLAVDAFTSLQTDYHNAFEDLKQYQQTTKDWLFGYLSYDLKNDTEDLKSQNFDGLQFPDLYFFQPKKLFLITGNRVEVQYLFMCDDEYDSDLREIDMITFDISESKSGLTMIPRITKESYLEKIGKMLEHIHLGDIYEANFCMEYYAEEAKIDPIRTFTDLKHISEPPFAAFMRINKHYLMCASPERYLLKKGTKIISQPIKGTSRRSADALEDEQIKIDLLNSEKERSENIMIVDLVRNDLSRTAAKGSVNVEELCGAYSFKQVHHLISTITSEVKEGFSALDVLKTTFPMGSMTGAPKISAMQIIEKLEETKRGLYSGSVGYFTPDGDFDFNVVIRSILYNQAENYVSFSVGSAITAGSDPESEYAECLLKAKAMLQVLR